MSHKIILFISCIVAVFADTLLVFYAKTKSNTPALLIVGIVLMNISALVWTYSMRKGIESSVAITVYALFTVAACSSIGIWIFKDHLSATNIAGIVLALVALVMIGI
jgi:multidrug transporter EmrE-like cation transporter